MLKEQVAEIRFTKDDLQYFPDGIGYLSEMGMAKVVNLFEAEVDKLTVIDLDTDVLGYKAIAEAQLQHTKKQLLDLMEE